MTEREKILNRVREALTVAAPHPGHHEGEAWTPVRGNAGKWLPAVGETFEEIATAFAEQSVELKTEFVLAENREASLARLKEIARTEGWKRVASHRGQLTDIAIATLTLPTLLTDSPYAVAELEQCDAGISECDALIAQTGSVLVTGRSAGGRALSVLPPHHVVLARREQLLRDLPAAYALLRQKYAGNYPSFISLITGPSRTGDIERILVLGAHGPRKLTVLCY